MPGDGSVGLGGDKRYAIYIESMIISPKGENTKDKDRRQIRIPEALKEHLEHLPDKTGTVLKYHGKGVESAKKAWRSVRKRLTFPGSEKLTLYSLRHNYATFLSANGVNLKDIADHMGHSSVRVTEIYNHYRGAVPVEKVELFSEVLAD
jgi:integrase